MEAGERSAWPRRTLVIGASGAGTTTLGRALADAWAVPHADADDYFWEPTEPPYTTKREPAARVALMEQVFLPRQAWVLSGSPMGWGDVLRPRVELVVLLVLDPAIRLARLEARERRRYGDRIAAGGDLEEALQEFLSWARGYDDPTFDGRNLAGQERWLAEVTCPVVRLDAARPVDELVAAILRADA